MGKGVCSWVRRLPFLLLSHVSPTGTSHCRFHSRLSLCGCDTPFLYFWQHRAMLMARLANGTSMPGPASSAPLPPAQFMMPTPAVPQARKPPTCRSIPSLLKPNLCISLFPVASAQKVAVMGAPSQCLQLKNMFDPSQASFQFEMIIVIIHLPVPLPTSIFDRKLRKAGTWI